MTTTLVLGGQRSGKSAFAEGLFDGLPKKTYLATATAGDGEMADRIALHQVRRGADWQTIEAATDIIPHLNQGPVLVDCLTLWLSNLMTADRDIEAETTALADAVARARGPLVLVSNEIGLGVIAANAMARAFADAQGLLNQRMADVADRVVLVAAGLPLNLKGSDDR